MSIALEWSKEDLGLMARSCRLCRSIFSVRIRLDFGLDARIIERYWMVF